MIRDICGTTGIVCPHATAWGGCLTSACCWTKEELVNMQNQQKANIHNLENMPEKFETLHMRLRGSSRRVGKTEKPFDEGVFVKLVEQKLAELKDKMPEEIVINGIKYRRVTNDDE